MRLSWWLRERSSRRLSGRLNGRSAALNETGSGDGMGYLGVYEINSKLFMKRTGWSE